MLSKYDIASISRGVSEGDFDPEGARDLLVEFKRQADETNYLSISREMLIHVNNAVSRYLNSPNNLTLDQAFGLVAKGRGKTKKSTRRMTADEQLNAAVRCLARRVLEGQTLEEACGSVAEEIGLSDEYVKKAYEKWGKEAVWLFRARHKDLEADQLLRLKDASKKLFPVLRQWPPAEEEEGEEE